MQKTILFTLLGAALGASQAQGAVWNTTLGAPVIWRTHPSVHRNRCSIANTGQAISAYWNAIGAWNDWSPVIESFKVNDASDCVIDHGDGENEVGLVNRADIDGAHGLTMWRVGFPDFGNIVEADVMLASDLSFSTVWGNTIDSSGRSVFVHEFGHFFGFQHDAGWSVMRGTGAAPITGGVEPATTFPRDTIGVNALYGFSLLSTLPNLLTAAVGPDDFDVVRTLDPKTELRVCRGAFVTLRFYLGNAGNLASGPYSLRLRIGQQSPPVGYFSTDTIAATFQHSLGAFTDGVFPITFRVPLQLSQDSLYWVYLDMDYSTVIPELREGDNTTLSAAMIHTASGC